MLLLLLLVFVLAALSLGLGAPWLTLVLPGGLPLGTVLAAAGLLAGAAVPLRVRPGGPRFRRGAGAVFALAAFWYPLGIALCGNLRLNFAGGVAAEVFRAYTVLAAAAVVAMMLLTVWCVVRQVLELSEYDE